MFIFSDKYIFVAGFKLRHYADHGAGGGDETKRLPSWVTGPESKQDPVMMMFCMFSTGK